MYRVVRYSNSTGLPGMRPLETGKIVDRILRLSCQTKRRPVVGRCFTDFLDRKSGLLSRSFRHWLSGSFDLPAEAVQRLSVEMIIRLRAVRTFPVPRSVTLSFGDSEGKRQTTGPLVGLVIGTKASTKIQMTIHNGRHSGPITNIKRQARAVRTTTGTSSILTDATTYRTLTLLDRTRASCSTFF
jgi:hypothetical protein